MKENEHLIDDEAEFAAAFDEDEGKPEDGEGDTEQAAEEPEAGDTEPEGKIEPKEEHEGEPEGDPDGEPEGEDKPEGEQQGDDELHDEVPEDVPEEDVQRYKSWEGRLRRREQELRELEQRLKEREAEIETSKPDEEPTSDSTGEPIGDEDIEAFLTEFPEMRGPLQKLIRQEVQKAIGQVEQKVESVTEAQRQAEVEAHIAAISQRHPDWRELVPEVDAWIETLPYRDAQEFIRIKESGTAAEVISMLDRFKADRKREQEREKLRKRRSQQKQAGQAVPNHPSRVGNMSASSDPDDFDSGWELPD